MNYKKKWLGTFYLLITIIFLSGCGSQESTAEVPPQDAPQDSTPEDFMSISEGFEKYPIWIRTNNYPERNSQVRQILHFDKGQLISYSNISDEDKLTIEELSEMKDEEIIEYAKLNANDIDDGQYKLDITLDSLGQNTQEINIILENYTSVITYDLLTLYWESGLPSEEEYVESLDKEGRVYEIKGEDITFTEASEEANSMSYVNGGMVSQTIFNTTYSGLLSGDDESLLTRVDESFSGFITDGPDTNKENITIEEFE